MWIGCYDATCFSILTPTATGSHLHRRGLCGDFEEGSALETKALDHPRRGIPPQESDHSSPEQAPTRPVRSRKSANLDRSNRREGVPQDGSERYRDASAKLDAFRGSVLKIATTLWRIDFQQRPAKESETCPEGELFEESSAEQFIARIYKCVLYG